MPDAAIAVDAAAAAPWARPLAYRGKSRDAAGILARNMLLSLVTVGFYRFWGKTRLRQYLWRNVTLLDDDFEYTGRGIELFYGFLIVVGVLLGLGLVVNGLAFLTAAGGATAGSPFDILYLLALAVLIPYAVYRARRYILSRTRWRGVRLVQDGSPWTYAWIALLGSLAIVMTLGIATPARAVWLYRYRTSNTRLGTETFSFHGRGTHLLKYWLVVVVVALPSVVWFVALQLLAFQYGVVEGGEASVDFDALPQPWGWVIAGGFLWMPVVFLTYLWYRVVEFRYFVRHTRFAGIEARASVRMRTVIGRLVVFYLVFILAAFGLFVLSVVVTNATAVAPYAPVAVILLLFLLVPLLRWLVVTLPLLRHFTQVLEVSDTAALDRVVQAAREQEPAFGEGLADALDADFGAF